MSGHRRYMRTPSSPESSSSGSWSSSWSSMWSSTTETDDAAHGSSDNRRLNKRSSAWLVPRFSHSSSSWVLLNRAGARRDDFRRDRTASAICRTSWGDQISVSFELVEPPGTSVLTVDWPPASTTTPRRGKPTVNVLAAHRDVVLLAMTSDEHANPTDMFVYWATSDRDDPSRRRRPSLSLLPPAGGAAIYCHLMDAGDIGTGIMSCTNNDGGSFVVAQLHMRHAGKSNHVRLFRSGSSQWVSFQNLHVHGADGGRELRWWSTDGVVPCGHRYMIWVDYYRGMVLMDLLSQLETMMTTNPQPPRLRYVPLPVNKVGDPKDYEFETRGCPKACRRVCFTRYGIKFVSVDSQQWSDFGVGNHHVLTWSHRFRITTWSLREDDTWRKDLTMHEEEFWDAFNGGDRRVGFPHVLPKFPVIDTDNPDVVIFRLVNHGYRYRDEPKWMIEVDQRKKVLLAATAYSNKESDGLSAEDGEDINSARIKYGFDPIPTELPRYLDGGQACKRRRR